jgi:hypothetical protein
MADNNVKLQLPKLELQLMQSRIIGDSPLICHAWSAKAKKAMLDKQMKKAKQAKTLRKTRRPMSTKASIPPRRRLRLPCRRVQVRHGRRLPLCRRHEDDRSARRVPHPSAKWSRSSECRRRARTWCESRWAPPTFAIAASSKSGLRSFTIQFNANVISAEQIVNLLTLAGFGVGVGEWRPERNGSFGRFHVATEETA